MDLIPKIIIIAERDCCESTALWLTQIQKIAQCLDQFPSVMLQIRAKTKPSLRWMALEQLPVHPQIYINGSATEFCRADFTIIHLPQREAPKKALSFPFGLSIHQPSDPLRYDELKPRYYQLGPIFTPLSKPGVGQGCDLIRATSLQTKTPIIAVGGITPKNIPNVLRAGALGVASSGYVMRHPDPIYAVTSMLEAMQ